MLLCNYRKCRLKLSGYAWVTACSHIFCEEHGSGEFSRSPALCPACNSTLSGKLDIVRTELSPSEEYKAMVLAGLRPEVVLDISSRALAFWTYQVRAQGLGDWAESGALTWGEDAWWQTSVFMCTNTHVHWSIIWGLCMIVFLLVWGGAKSKVLCWKGKCFTIVLNPYSLLRDSLKMSFTVIFIFLINTWMYRELCLNSLT